MDVLADLFSAAGVRGAAGARVELGRDWGAWTPAGHPNVHAMVDGDAWLRVGEHPLLHLRAGDVVLVPHGTAHVFASDPAAARRTTPERQTPIDERAPGHTSVGAAPYDGRMLCAHYRFDGTASRPVLDGLPDVVHVSSGAGSGVRAEPGLADLVTFLHRELEAGRAGSAVVLDRLVDVLLVELVRTWIAQADPDGEGSALCALNDPVVGAAVAAIHADPGRDWTTDALARELHVSRATLARRFPAVIGETPGAYLTRWRMDVAARHLRDGDEDVPTVARAVGYASAPAFNRAFRRARGTTPGRFRAAARAA